MIKFGIEITSEIRSVLESAEVDYLEDAKEVEISPNRGGWSMYNMQDVVLRETVINLTNAGLMESDSCRPQSHRISELGLATLIALRQSERMIENASLQEALPPESRFPRENVSEAEEGENRAYTPFLEDFGAEAIDVLSEPPLDDEDTERLVRPGTIQVSGGQTLPGDTVDEIRRRAARHESLSGMIPARQYVSDIGYLLEVIKMLNRQIALEQDAVHSNYQLWERSEDERERLQAENNAYRRGQRT